MTENVKTIAFVVLGLLAVALGLVTRPRSAELQVDELRGTPLAEKFNADDAKKLRIVQFNEQTATLKPFEVAEDEKGIWTIPSKEGYPADAKERVAKAATSLMDRT